MLIKKPSDMRYSEVTPKHVYLNRRQFIAGAAAAAGVAAVGAHRSARMDAAGARARCRKAAGSAGEKPFFDD